MFLKKVEISGFKSFANKTTLEFLPACNFNGEKKGCGITAIVGPNGSGKSNVADAISWAMGEQSMKNLRGKKSEDVIFSGSGKKARLGSAWATLYFDNSDKRIPLEFSEVAISRKLFRNGESEYLINDSRVRLIDVIDLLAKAGVGKESYCVVSQGMSDSVLSATPAERRSILEDAAGVKQYQIKKERAIRKLESTRNNLERAGDLIKEIKPHLRMLKRQAEKAQKGKEVAQELKEKQIKLFSYLWSKFESEKNNVSGEKNDLGAKMSNAQRQVDKLNDELSQESEKALDSKAQEEMEKRKQDLYQELNNLEKEMVIAEGRIEIEKERMEQQRIIETIPVDLGYVKSRLERVRQNQEKLINRLNSVEDLSELQDIKEFARAIQQELYDLYKDVGEGEVKIDRSASKVEGKDRIESLGKKQEELTGKISKCKSEIEKTEKNIEEEIEKDKQTREKFFQLERELYEKQKDLDKFKDNFNEAKIKLAKVEVREEDLVNEIKSELKLEAKDLKYDGQPCDRNSLEGEISKLKVQMEQIGGIDPLIVEEYEEVNKRHEFLSQESKDLEKAIGSLNEVIKEMDQKISKTFNQAFEKINKEFTNYFRIIFGGGNAHLVKAKIQKRRLKKEADDPSTELGAGENKDEDDDKSLDEARDKEEIGIDISACPPGKKITNLTMLSGGERSLTSIALLFAIISYNPPPFAVLDEVEAALDEANSRRFGRILQELSHNTQFVIITHNRETMRQASLLYGVTMGEDGISKLLSVHLDQIGQEGGIKK